MENYCRKDRATKEWREDHADELDPAKMSPSLLASAITYCETICNPFTDEIVRRSGVRKRYETEPLRDTMRRACRHYNIQIL